MKKIFLILFCFLSIYSFGFDQTSVIQMTLTDARSGLLNGNYAVELLLVDNATNKTYWTQNQTIFFKDGFTEFIIGPFENLNFLLKPRIQLKIEDSLIEFPIHPTLFSIQSHRSSQLNDTDAIYTKSGNVGLGTTDPSSKLTVNGNLSFLDSTNGIIFNNGKKISGPIWQNLESSLSELSNTVSTSQTAITDLTSSIQSLVASVNILQTQTGASPLVVNSSLDNMILKIDSNGTISPLTDFYFNDSNHYMLLSNNNSLISTELSDQFIVRDNQLFVATSNPLEIISTDLTLPLHGNGEIRYFNQDYYLFNSGVWERINSGDLDYLKLPSKTITSLVPGTSNGGLAFDGTEYYFWKNGWTKLDFPEPQIISTKNTLNSVVVTDSNGGLYKRHIVDDISFKLTNTGIQINDSNVTSNHFLVWSGNSFKSINPSSTEIKFQNEKLYFAEPLFVSNNALGIGVSPSETLDVNGTIRMRTQALSSLSNVSAGSLIFDGSNFLGWNGTHWKNLSASSNINTVEPDSYWIYDDVHLIASPNHNVGIKISNPQATLDINGNLRIRSTLNSGMSDFLTINSFGDVGQHSLNIQDLISNTVTTSIQLIGNQLILSSMNANEGDFLVYQNEQWRPINLTTSALLTYSDHHLDISTANLVNDSILLFRNNQWDYFSLPTTNSNIVFNNGWAFSLEDSNTDDIFIVKNGEWVRKTLVSDQILHADNGLRLASQNAVLGQQLTWNGDSWIPSNNSSILFNGENGVVVEGNTIKLANNLAWTGSKFTIGTTSGAEFKINRLTSTLSSPIQLVNASNQTLLNVNNSGQLSIGYNGVHSGYSIASNGVNLFAHSLSRYQSSVGTTNIGTAEFGPTLLIASVPTANPSPSRSIIEVLDVNGTSRFEVQDGGNVGISTGSPQATLDINGFAKLKKYSSQPKSCTTETDGAIALTSSYRLCVCDSTKWVNSNDGISLCEW